MITVQVTLGGSPVALIHFFGHHVYDPKGWPRVRLTDGEPPGFRVVNGELPAEVAPEIWEAVLKKPIRGTVGEYAYQLADPPPDSPSGRRVMGR
jgi:hypothetical protein